MNDFERAAARLLRLGRIKPMQASGERYADAVTRYELRRAFELLGLELAPPSLKTTLNRPCARSPCQERREAIDEWAALAESEKVRHIRRIISRVASGDVIHRVVDLAAGLLLDIGDTALESVARLLTLLPKPERYAVAEFFLFRRACSDDVRGAMLRFAWESHAYGPFGPGIEQTRDYLLEIPVQSLMEAWEIGYVATMADEVLLFRGAAVDPRGIEATATAMSWTTRIEVAALFASRAQGAGVVMSLTVPRDAILAFFINDIEFVVDPRPYFSTLRVYEG